MQFALATQQPATIKTDCLILLVRNPQRLSPLAKQLNNAANKIIDIMREVGELARFKQMILIPAPLGLAAKRLLLVHASPEEKMDYENFKALFETIYNRIKQTSSQSICFLLDDLSVAGHSPTWTLQQATKILADLTYTFEDYKSKKSPRELTSISFYCPASQQRSQQKALQETLAVIAGINLTKDLGNTPCNIAIPTYLAKQAQQLAKTYRQITAKIHGEAELKRLKMGALLAVGAGSQQESQLIELHYRGSKQKQINLALVGKGVTFDTGGISIKPGPGMEEMKYDMCGAATVLGVLKIVAELRLPINVIGLIPSAENMPDGASYKPGDVITSMSGQTIEIQNTDAEGRMLLCDALHYAQQFKPKILIDIATLTGAMVVALGPYCNGFFTSKNDLAKQLLNAAEQSVDAAWRMPLREEFVKETDSKVADMKNIGSRWGGACTAAGFLSRFVDHEQPWIHMDIAGTAYKMGNSVGATGRPVALLVEFIKNLR